jgi:hypothetical protein
MADQKVADIEQSIRSGAYELVKDPLFWIEATIPIVVIGLAALLVWAVQNPDKVLLIVTDPATIRDTAVAVTTLVFLLFIYVYVLRPEIRVGVLSKIDQQCPDRWIFSRKSGKCEPTYPTQCKPFFPSDSNLQSYRDQCRFASKCGTNWGGVCQ